MGVGCDHPRDPPAHQGAERPLLPVLPGPDLDPDRPVPRLAAAVARLAAADPARYASTAPEGLELVYARSGLDDR